MSSELDKEKQRLEEEARRRKEEEEIRRQVREKYEEAERRAREASERGAEIAKREVEEGRKLREEQTRGTYEEAQQKLRTPTYLQTIPSDKGGSAKPGSAPQSSTVLPLTTIASPPPRAYYVIIGCGTAAVVNHTTLRQTQWGTKERIAGLPVMHIGFNDPWAHYIPHGMGQPPYLLTMPGYHKRPSQANDVFARNPGCSSDRFAACTQYEWDELWKKYHNDDERLDKFAWKEAFVVWIESAAQHPDKGDIKAKLKEEGLDLDAEKVKEINKAVAGLDGNYVPTGGEARYRLLIVVPQDETTVKLEYVYADMIDICVGPGRPRIPDGAEWKEGRTKLWTPPRLWGDQTKKRKLVNGPEAFYTETIWNTTDRVYINGGGGIGLNMAERAEIVGCFADWAPTGTLHNTFNLPRNDIVLKHPYKNINQVRDPEITEYFNVIAGDSRATILVAPWLIEERSRQAFANKEDLKSRIKIRRAELEAKRMQGVELFKKLERLDDAALFELLLPSLEPKSHGAQMTPGQSGIREPPFMAPSNNKAVLTPAFNKWRFGSGSEPAIVRVETDKVIVKITGAQKVRGDESKGRTTPAIRDYYYINQGTNDKGVFLLSQPYREAFPELNRLDESAGAVYNRICLTTGIVMDRQMGTSDMFAKAFTFDSLPAPGDGRTVGLQADAGRIRILGAAAQAHPSNKFKIAKPQQVEPENDPASKFFFTLPMSAVVPGFIFTGVNIAEANHYFAEGSPNVNINTMTMSELKEAVSDLLELAELDEFVDEKDLQQIAAAVGKHRRLGNGYETPADIANALQGDETVTSVSRWESVVGKLKTDYSPARDFLD